MPLPHISARPRSASRQRGRAVAEHTFDAEQARNVVQVIQGDIGRLPTRLAGGRFNQSELLLQLANDVDILAEIVIELIDAMDAETPGAGPVPTAYEPPPPAPV